MPIRTVAICVLAAIAIASVVPSIEGAPTTLSMSASPTSASVVPNGTASFVLNVTNSALLSDNVNISASADYPVGWRYDLQPATFTINASESKLVALTIIAAPDATVGQTFNLTFTGQGSTPLDTTNPVTLQLAVVAPPPTTTPPPSQPVLSLSASPSSGAAGGSASGTLTLTSDTNKLDVAVSARAPSGWAIAFPDGNERRMSAGVPVTVSLVASIPATAVPGTVQTIDIIATAGTFTYDAAWNVTVLAPVAPTTQPTQPTQPTQQPSSGGSGGSGGASSGSSSPTPAATSIALSVAVSPGTISIAPGQTATANVTLYNTGTQPLHLTLQGNAADNWPLHFQDATVDVAPGVTRDVPMTLTAPDDIFPGGTGSGSVMVQGDSGLLRTSGFKLQIVAPTTPRDESKASAAVAVPQGSDNAFHISSTAATLVVGLGAVGAGALALTRRPIRDKAIWIGVGLYTRLARPDVLGHPERERLYHLVETQPGVHFHALQRELQWNTGTLTYHLRVLERHGFIVDRRDGSYRRFYIQGAAPKKEAFSQDAPQGLRADVLEAIRNHHGISQSDLALALGANKQTVNYHVKALERQGAIRIEKRGRDTFLYPTNAPGVGPGEVPA